MKKRRAFRSKTGVAASLVALSIIGALVFATISPLASFGASESDAPASAPEPAVVSGSDEQTTPPLAPVAAEPEAQLAVQTLSEPQAGTQKAQQKVSAPAPGAMAPAAVTSTIDVGTGAVQVEGLVAGQLQTELNTALTDAGIANQYDKIRSVTVTGSINSTDIAFLRNKVAFGSGTVKALDFSGATMSGAMTTYQFYGFIELETMRLPRGVTALPDYAFYCCYKLKTVTGLGSLTSLGAHVFDMCYDLTTVDDVSQVRTLGDYAFSHCYVLQSLNFSSRITKIGDYVCSGNHQLTSFGDVSNVTSVGKYAFTPCVSITSMNFSDKLTSIGDLAFHNMTAVTTLGDFRGVTRIGGNAVSNCPNLREVKLSDKLKTVGAGAFIYDELLRNVGDLSNVTSMGDFAFSGIPYFDEDSAIWPPVGSCTYGNGVFYGDAYDFTTKTFLTTGTGVDDVYRFGNQTPKIYFGYSDGPSSTIMQNDTFDPMSVYALTTRYGTDYLTMATSTDPNFTNYRSYQTNCPDVTISDITLNGNPVTSVDTSKTGVYHYTLSIPTDRNANNFSIDYTLTVLGASQAVKVEYYKDSVASANLLGTAVIPNRTIGERIAIASGLSAGELDYLKPDGYRSGVQVNSDYVVVDGENVVQVLYTKAPAQNTPPVVTADDAIYIMKGTTFEQIPFLEAVHAKASDKEDGTYPLSRIEISGWSNIKWDVVNDETNPYVITLSVTDNDGAKSEPKDVKVFIVDKGDDEKPTKPTPKPQSPAKPTLPSGYRYVSTGGKTVVTSVPKTGDTTMPTPLLALALVSSLAVAAVCVSRMRRARLS